jgi:sugar/nucleoside kinase (ribokinase family)
VVGHASRDLVDDDPRGWRLGGSATYVSHALARLGIPVRAAIGVDPDAARSAELTILESAGVELARVALDSGPVFRNVESDAGRLQESLAAARPLTPSDVPQAWRDAPAWALVPIFGEVSGSAWSGTPDPDSLVALGWQGMLRAAASGGPTVKRTPFRDPVVARADVTVVGTDDLPSGDAEDVERLADLFPRPGQELVLTAGARGGRLFVRTEDGWTSHAYDAAATRALDPTGAGDVFLATYLATGIDPSLAGDDLAARLRFAAIVAAMSVEGPGITTTPTRDEVQTRFRGTGG